MQSSQIWGEMKSWYDAQTDAYPTEEEIEEERYQWEWVLQEAHIEAYYEHCEMNRF